MKRSEINLRIREMEQLCEKVGFKLPPFLSFTPEQWQNLGHEYDEIRDNMLGWDVTDYGGDDWEKLGNTLITLRNGNVHNSKYTKTYAEKLCRNIEGQISPMHFHWNKMEDLINRGGGNLLVKLYHADANGELDHEREVEICSDGRRYYVPAGTEVRLKPGESVTMYPYYHHEIRIEPGTKEVLIGEVSMCNDDNTDNRFLEPLARFSTIEEDEPPYRLLCKEYPPAKD